MVYPEQDVYSEPWHYAYSWPEAYCETLQTSTMKRFAKRVNSYNYFYKVLFFYYFILAISAFHVLCFTE